MPTGQAIILTDRGVIDVAGPDAATLLQGLITNDIARATPARAIYAALLTPQGKVIYDFLIAANPDGGFFVDCPKAHTADLTARLKKYRLRAKVTLTDRSGDLAVAALSLNANIENAFEDPRLRALGSRAIMPAASVEAALKAAGFDLATEAAYEERRLTLGVPGAADIAPEEFFPLDCNFEELHGVDFEKGCYVGQELTARMKHRATARRRMLPVGADVPLPPAGTPLKVGTTDIGELRGATGARGMALVRLDRLGTAETAIADGVTVRIGRPAYPLIVSSGDHA